MKEKKNVPELRFPEFKEPWKKCKLGEIVNIIDPHPSHRAPMAIQKGIPFIGIGDVNELGEINYSSSRIVSEHIYEEHHNRYDLAIPSLGIGRVASLGKVIRLRNDIGKYAVSPTISILQTLPNMDINYLYACMNSPIFQRQFVAQSNGSTRQSVGIQDLRNLVVSIPVFEKEQYRLGQFFSNVDKIIVFHQHKENLLKALKKGMLQKIFSQELRFKDDNGQDFPDWEENKLGDICDSFYAGQTPTSNKAEYYDGDIPWVASGDLNRGIIIKTAVYSF
ncbi:restriction endonuclease subunit S [Mitsuokella sp.]|uniref:restriction endonuclease subunit S n=1 Tax=Mitsuokella sp. TaxID=2049034 RepID=UPI003D7DCA1A